MTVHQSSAPRTASSVGEPVLAPLVGDLYGYEQMLPAEDQAVLLGPVDLMTDLPDQIEGADRLHRVLVGMLEKCGQRSPRVGDRRGAVVRDG